MDLNRVPAASSKIWFPAKRWGWGWGPPICWQGWVVLAAYGALMLTGGLARCRKPHFDQWFDVYVLGLSAMLMIICWIKGEKPRWRWGEKDLGD
ncbi:hypothetical protein EBZ70_06755 [bacterium]|nr:hypothetical protein [bacterium]